MKPLALCVLLLVAACDLPTYRAPTLRIVNQTPWALVVTVDGVVRSPFPPNAVWCVSQLPSSSSVTVTLPYDSTRTPSAMSHGVGFLTETAAGWELIATRTDLLLISSQPCVSP